MADSTRTIPRDEWWRRYAEWQLGKRDGPLCVECGESIPEESLAPFCLCEACVTDLNP